MSFNFEDALKNQDKAMEQLAESAKDASTLSRTLWDEMKGQAKKELEKAGVNSSALDGFPALELNMDETDPLGFNRKAAAAIRPDGSGRAEAEIRDPLGNNLWATAGRASDGSTDLMVGGLQFGNAGFVRMEDRADGSSDIIGQGRDSVGDRGVFTLTEGSDGKIDAHAHVFDVLGDGAAAGATRGADGTVRASAAAVDAAGDSGLVRINQTPSARITDRYGREISI